MFSKWIILVLCMLLECNNALPIITSNITQIQYEIDERCVKRLCRLNKSSDSFKVFVSAGCEQESCSKLIEKKNHLEEELHSLPLAIELLDVSSNTMAFIQQMIQLNDIFVFHRQQQEIHDVEEKEEGLGKIMVWEYGNQTHGPISMLYAFQQNTFGKVGNIHQGPIRDWEEDLFQFKRIPAYECIRKVRRNNLLLFSSHEANTKQGQEKLNNIIMKHCLSPDRIADEEDEKESRLELWGKAGELGLLSEEDKLQSPYEFIEALFKEHNTPNEKQQEEEIWLSISWVPVYDEFHDGLGHGERYEVILMELVSVFELNNIPNASPIITLFDGTTRRVLHRKFAGLIACKDDDLESVIHCVKKAVPNIYQVNRIVWSSGFTGDYNHYGEIKNDWNDDTIYKSHGKFPPRFEDQEANKKTTYNDDDDENKVSKEEL